MTAELVIAGVCRLILAVGHTLIGLRCILPSLAEVASPRTPFGPPSLTVGSVRFTWQMFSVILPGFGILFLILASTDANPMTLSFAGRVRFGRRPRRSRYGIAAIGSAFSRGFRFRYSRSSSP